MLRLGEAYLLAGCLVDARQLAEQTLALSRDRGRRVLLVEGRFIESQWDVYHMSIDWDGTGHNVYAISYSALKNKSPAHLNDALEAFQSIVWKSESPAKILRGEDTIK